MTDDRYDDKGRPLEVTFQIPSGKAHMGDVAVTRLGQAMEAGVASLRSEGYDRHADLVAGLLQVLAAWMTDRMEAATAAQGTTDEKGMVWPPGTMN